MTLDEIHVRLKQLKARKAELERRLRSRPLKASSQVDFFGNYDEYGAEKDTFADYIKNMGYNELDKYLFGLENHGHKDLADRLRAFLKKQDKF